MGNVSIPDLARDLIINIINIGVLFIIVKSLVYKPVKKYLDARTERVKTASYDADKRTAEAGALKNKYEKLLAEQSAAKSAAIAEGEKLGREQAAQLVTDATERAKKLISDAERKNRVSYDKMLEDAKGDIADLAIDISAKLLAREITDADNRNIVERFLNN